MNSHFDQTFIGLLCAVFLTRFPPWPCPWPAKPVCQELPPLIYNVPLLPLTLYLNQVPLSDFPSAYWRQIPPCSVQSCVQSLPPILIVLTPNAIILNEVFFAIFNKYLL